MKLTFLILGALAAITLITFIVLCIAFANVVSPGFPGAVSASETLDVFVFLIPALVVAFAIAGAVAIARSQGRHKAVLGTVVIVGSLPVALVAYLVFGFITLLAIPPTGW